MQIVRSPHDGILVVEQGQKEQAGDEKHQAEHLADITDQGGAGRQRFADAQEHGAQDGESAPQQQRSESTRVLVRTDIPIKLFRQLHTTEAVV